MKIVFLDAATMGDVSFSPISALGELECFQTSDREEALQRVKDAEVLIINKIKVDKELVDAAPKLRLICEAATGVNNIDLEYAASKGIPVRNAVGYSTDSVVQMTFMMILSLVGRCRYFDDFVKSGEYSRSGLFTDVSKMFFELRGKRLGIIGLGNGNPNCHEPEKGDRRSLFNGLAQVIVQSAEESGEVTLTATVEGLEPAVLKIPVRPAPAVPSVAVENPPQVLGGWTVSPFYNGRPDVTRRIADNDMNSWQPVTVPSGTGILLERGGYVMFRTECALHQACREKGGAFLFKRLSGKAEIWLDGKRIATKEDAAERDFEVEFGPVGEKCELRVLFHASSGERVGMKGVVQAQSY